MHSTFLVHMQAGPGSSVTPDSASTAPAHGQHATAAAALASEHRWKAAVPQPSAQTGGVWGRSPDLGVGWKCVSDASAVTEVHLRRLDATDELHRRVVAVLTVDATPEEVCLEVLCVTIVCAG